MEVWPATLPIPSREYGYAYRSGLVNFEEDINPQRSRTYPERDADFVIDCLTPAQYAAFRVFYYTTLNNGAEFFSADWLALIGFTFHRLRFLNVFNATYDGVLWTVELALEIVAVVPFEEGSPAIWLCEEAT